MPLNRTPALWTAALLLASATPALASEVLIFGDRQERELVRQHLTDLGYAVDVFTSVPANVLSYGMVWHIGITPLSSTEMTQMQSVLAAGGGVYLTGENPNLSALNASIQTLVRGSVAGGSGIVLGAQFVDGPYIVNPGAAGGVGAGLTTIPMVAAGSMSGVSGENVFATGAGGVPVAGVWTSSQLVDGSGNLAVFMDVNWPQPSSSDVTANLASFLFARNVSWQGGNGAWGDPGRWGNRTPSAKTDATINPAGSATVLGAADATVNRLGIAGNAGHIVTLDLNGGSTAAIAGTEVAANGVLAGNGRLVGDLAVRAGGRVNVGAGESMQLTGGAVANSGTVRILGTSASAATLEAAGAVTNNAGAQINLQNADVSFLGGLANAGQVNTTFGVTNVSGTIGNLAGGRIIVSNGAQASFFDAVTNNGELRVSEGGSANFFGTVSGAGMFTGAGDVRYEGGFAPGNSLAEITVEHHATYTSSSVIEIELGQFANDKIIFDNAVTLGGGDLNVLWYEGWTGAANQSYDIFDWDGGVTGGFANIFLPTLSGDLYWNTADLYTSGVLSINAPIPEPQTYALLLAGLGLLGFAAMRRRR